MALTSSERLESFSIKEPEIKESPIGAVLISSANLWFASKISLGREAVSIALSASKKLVCRLLAVDMKSSKVMSKEAIAALEAGEISGHRRL